MTTGDDTVEPLACDMAQRPHSAKQAAHDQTQDCWRAALWLLEALPPSRRAGANAASPLRRKKMRTCVRAVAGSDGDANRSLHQEVVPGARFIYALMWWVGIRGVDDATLHNWNHFQMQANAALMRVAMSQPVAHAMLMAFARTRTLERDTAFTDGEIRAATLGGLLGS